MTRYQNWDELFDYCRYSANPVGRLVLRLVRLQRCRAQTAFGRHLHRPAARQLLAGRDGGSSKRPRLSSAAICSRRHGYTVDDLSARRFNPAFQAVMREAVERGARAFPRRPAAGENGESPPGVRSRTVQPRRPAHPGKNRATRLQRPGRAPGRYPKSNGWDCCSRALARPRSHSCERMQTSTNPTNSAASIARTRAQNFYYSFLLLSRATTQRHVRHLRLHALLRRHQRSRRRDRAQPSTAGERIWIARWRAAPENPLSGRHSTTLCSATRSRMNYFHDMIAASVQRPGAAPDPDFRRTLPLLLPGRERGGTHHHPYFRL